MKTSRILWRLPDAGGPQVPPGTILELEFVSDGPPRGRKPNLNRSAAVLLGHAWHAGCLGMTPGAADRALVPLLGYSDERAVRRIRADKKISGHYLMVFRCADGGCAILLDRSATVAVAGDELRFDGSGWLWEYGRPEATYQEQWRGKATIAQSENELQALDDLKRWAGGGT